MNQFDPDNATYNYYARRERQERFQAERSIDPAARCAHHELAMRYAELTRAELTCAVAA